MNRNFLSTAWNKAKDTLVSSVKDTARECVAFGLQHAPRATKFALAGVTILGLGGLVEQPAQAALSDIVAYSSGAVTFAPENAATPIITGIIAAIGVSAAIYVIWVGLRWVYRLIKGAK